MPDPSGKGEKVMQYDTTVSLFDKSNLQKYLQRKLRAFYQPKVGVNGSIAGVEVLARLCDECLPETSKVAPIAFIDQAGLLSFMTMTLLDQALNVSAQVRQRCGKVLPVAINLHAEQLLDVTLLDAIVRSMNAMDFPASAVTLEIVEKHFDGDMDQLARRLEHARALGFRISLDDFGTGESNWHRLLSLPVHEWKLARELVNGVATSKVRAVLVRKLLEIGKELGMTTVVEGIDNKADLAWLRDMGQSDIVIQGYVVARPMSAATLKGWLTERTSAPVSEPMAIASY
jgi:EAL domain-containing protein (putative c-di-GMP-specific phosphodiesterase class I)